MIDNGLTSSKIVFFKKILFRLLLIILIVVVAFFLSRYVLSKNESQNQLQRQRIYAPMVSNDNQALLDFQSMYPERKIILACEDDVTNDGIKDLLFIYKEDSPTEGKITRLVVSMVQADESYIYTNPIPAPIDNQGIQFKNIDQENEMEFIISGEKNGASGYAIYRIIDGEPMDLFGDGMEDCC